MRKQREPDGHLVRSSARIRESVRSLPKGHFQQIRQMFDKQSSSAKKLSTIYERQQPIPVPSHVLLKLPVTDDEKLQHTHSTLDEHYRDYLAEYQAFRHKMTDELLEQPPKTISPSPRDASVLKPTSSLPVQTQTTREPLSYPISFPEEPHSPAVEDRSPVKSSLLAKNHRRSAMEAAVNYTDSYDKLAPSYLKRTGSTRQYASSLQRPLFMDAKPVFVTAKVTEPLKRAPSTVSNELYETTIPSLRVSGRIHSSTSLSSTGYDSNSSPSMKSNRNSVATNNSNDFIVNSTSSSSSASLSSSSDEQQRKGVKPWRSHESNPARSNQFSFTSAYRDSVFEDDLEPTIVTSRTQINLSQPLPEPVVRHAIIRSSPPVPYSSATSSPLHEPIIAKSKTNRASYILQTTSFADPADDKVDRKIRRWNNVYAERTKINDAPGSSRQHPLTSTSSTGFQVTALTTEHEAVAMLAPILQRNREQSPLPVAENPLFHPAPPKKPPRTFEQANKYDHLSKTKDEPQPSLSSSQSNSPTVDLGARSVSCMDLTAGVSNALLSGGLLPLEHQPTEIPRRSSNVSEIKTRFADVENDNGALKSPSTAVKVDPTPQPTLYNSSHAAPAVEKSSKRTGIFHTPTIKRKNNEKLVMKKGVSEPNLAKNPRSKSPGSTFFSPRHLIDRFKRMLPLSTSKQSLNEKVIHLSENNPLRATVDSDDSGSTSSENNDHHRLSRLDHVSRVRSIYDTLGSSSHMSSLIADPSQITPARELTSLYDYVVHLLPEQELGYFSHGNGCLSSSNINQSPFPKSTPIRFKYPPDAKDEATLKYFCFPDQHDSNNNPMVSSSKPPQEFYRFTLTNMHGVRQYGYCSRFFHKSQLNALCLISPYDMIELYERILATATELFVSYKDDHARKFLQEIYPHRIPTRGDSIHIATSTVGLYALKCDQDRRKALIDSITLLGLSTDTIIKIFSSILYEQKLIFIGNELGPLTRLIDTFVCLLYPFSWPHTYVPILPALMLDIIQAPTPYIIGILRSCESYLVGNDDLISQDHSDILIVDIDHDRVRSISDYLSSPSTRGSVENLAIQPTSQQQPIHFQILPKIFKIELKQEISLLRKNRSSLSLEDCQQRLRDVFMSIFVQSCFNYREFFYATFDREAFIHSKQHTIQLFLEWFTRTQLFELFIRQKSDSTLSNAFAVTFDLACENYYKTLNKQATQRITAKSVKRKSATRANKQENRF